MKKFSSIALFGLGVFLPGVAAAQDASSGQGVSALLGGGLIPACLRDPEQVRTSDISCVTSSITHFTSLILLGVALGSFIYMLYGAFLYATAFSDEKKVEQGKKSITYAIIGIVIAILSELLVAWVRGLLGA